MKFGIDKCAVLELERGRLVRSEGIEFLDGERMKEVDQEGYKYLGICKSNLNAENFISGLNALAECYKLYYIKLFFQNWTLFSNLSQIGIL